MTDDSYDEVDVHMRIIVQYNAQVGIEHVCVVISNRPAICIHISIHPNECATAYERNATQSRHANDNDGEQRPRMLQQII